MIEVLATLIAFAACALLTGVVRRYALKVSLLDLPNARSSHSVPTPRGGGIAIVFVFVVGLSVLAALGLVENRFALTLGCTSLLVAGIGFADDRKGVAASARFAVQVTCVTIFLAAYLWPIPLAIPLIDRVPVLAFAILVLSMVWLLNLFNFMDGIDGIAAAEVASVGVGLIVVAGLNVETDHLRASSLLLVASTIGFACWNWPPAKIFLGDVGSGFLGFVVGCLLLGSVRQGSITFCVALILPAAFITDATITLIRRVFRGERWYEAHRSHAYQWLSRRWQSRAAVVWVLLAINVLWLLPMAIAAESNDEYAWLVVFAAYVPLATLAVLAGSGRAEHPRIPN
jgi:Fuc2NAc and GlcNAc transferase